MNSRVIVNCSEEWRLGSPFLLYWWHQKNFRRKQWHPAPLLLPGKSHGRSSLVGCNAWGCKESDTTERLHFHFSLSCIGERNGNPLQCSSWRIPGTGEPGGLPSMGLHRVRHDWSDLAAAADKFLFEDGYRVIFGNEIFCTWDLKNRFYLKKLWNSKADKSYCMSPFMHQKCFSDTNVPMNHLWIQQKQGSQDKVCIGAFWINFQVFAAGDHALVWQATLN